MKYWTSGNRLELLENGDEFFPRVFDAIRRAEREVLLETFIWAEDKTGLELLDALVEAAGRKVRIRVTVDGYGSPAFSREFLARVRAAGIRLEAFDPRPTLFRLRTNMLCRLHRKIVVVDRSRAFIGGINFCEEHLLGYGAEAKQDYAVEVTGPVVEAIHRHCIDAAEVPDGLRRRQWRYWIRRFPREMMQPSGDAQALYVVRNNESNPTDIETMYRVGIRSAKRRIVIANAYFFPGYRFIRDLAAAARRGVRVQLIVQGKPDRPISIGIASIIYEDLLAAGVEVLRYVERPLHAKVAIIDDHWSTIGSSNLDPTSLGLNLEANLFLLDARFNEALAGSLDRLIERACEPARTASGRPSLLRRLLLTIAYHLTRRMSSWGRRVRFRDQHVRPLPYTGPPGGARG